AGGAQRLRGGRRRDPLRAPRAVREADAQRAGLGGGLDVVRGWHVPVERDQLRHAAVPDAVGVRAEVGVVLYGNRRGDPAAPDASRGYSRPPATARLADRAGLRVSDDDREVGELDRTGAVRARPQGRQEHPADRVQGARDGRRRPYSLSPGYRGEGTRKSCVTWTTRQTWRVTRVDRTLRSSPAGPSRCTASAWGLIRPGRASSSG